MEFKGTDLELIFSENASVGYLQDLHEATGAELIIEDGKVNGVVFGG